MRRRIGLLTVALAIGASLIGSGTATAETSCADGNHPGGDWPVYGQDLHNTRDQENETTIGVDNVDALSPKWVFSAAAAGGVGTIESSPVVAEGCVFIATQAGDVFALNADSGDVVWHTAFGAPATTLSVANGRVFATLDRADNPALVALAVNDGSELWATVLTTMPGSDATGSPVAFGDMVASGTSCEGAELSSGDARLTCRGSFSILDQATGEILAQDYSIPDDDFAAGYAGGGMWSAPAIDLEDGYAYMGVGNPFSAREHPRTNAIVKIDIDRQRPTFGKIVDSYKATGEQYLPILGTYKPLCEASGSNVGACEAPDLDMAMAPNIFFNEKGQKMVGDGQSSGIYHAVLADTMEYVWQTVTGPPFAAARSGGSAYDGKRIYSGGGVPGQLWALEKEGGSPDWVMPVLGPNVFNTVQHANGVIYTSSGGSLGGGNVSSWLLAFEAETGDPLLARPYAPDIADIATSVQAGGPVIARNTIYAPVNGTLGGGHIVAYGL